MSEYFVQRLYLAGRRVQKHERIAGKSRGTLRIEPEKIGRRLSLVARLHVDTMSKEPRIPALVDVRLLGTSSSCLVLTGAERVEPTILDQAERLLGQTWLVEPTPMRDLMAVEQKMGEIAREREELRLQLRALLDERLAALPLRRSGGT